MITIVFLPDGARKVRQLKVPKFLIRFFALVCLSAVALLAWASYDYYSIKLEVLERIHLQKENQQQRVQLAALSKKIDQINTKMVELKKFDHKLKVMVNLESSEDNTQFLGVGGSDPTLLDPEYTIEKAHRKLVRLMHQSLDNLDTDISVQTQDKAELYRFLEDQKSMFACTPSIWPAKGWISSRFGYRISPFTNEKEFHNGLDVNARTGTSIIAPADGVVASTGKTYGYGMILTINHGYGLKTRYAHLSKFLVKKGQVVKRGQKIALMGNTGRSTGTHLHYEVHLKGVPVNPLRYILN
ncbi:MAG: peptidoglycan DD-metalloendopeptidase family protein [Deltaproteobacteria bacterium]|nr:peptidoglycan DD-metalloendopeptidase family protein [Deltaproteobacteria bacterium]